MTSESVILSQIVPYATMEQTDWVHACKQETQVQFVALYGHLNSSKTNLKLVLTKYQVSRSFFCASPPAKKKKKTIKFENNN